jgi:hypothetical protein
MVLGSGALSSPLGAVVMVCEGCWCVDMLFGVAVLFPALCFFLFFFLVFLFWLGGCFDLGVEALLFGCHSSVTYIQVIFVLVLFQ